MKRRSPYLRSIAGALPPGLPILNPPRVRVWPLRPLAAEPPAPPAHQTSLPRKGAPLLTPRISEGTVRAPASSTPVTPSSFTDASPRRTAPQADMVAQAQTPAIEPSARIDRTATIPPTTSAASPAEQETPVWPKLQDRRPAAEVLADRHTPPTAKKQNQALPLLSGPDSVDAPAPARVRPESEVSARGNTVHIGSLDIHITPPTPQPVGRVIRRSAPAPATGIARGFISAIGFRQG
jgi:hypothetical protein